MNSLRKAFITAVVLGAIVAAGQDAPAAQQARQVGSIKSASGTNIIMTTDAGTEVNVLVLVATRMVRIAPGQTDLKNATPVLFKELQAGDRILVRGTATSADGKAITASSIVLMKSTDVAQKKEQELQDWEKRGVGGLVTTVDVQSGEVKVNTGTRPVTVKATKGTIVRRYSPDSVKFEDAVKAKLADILPGDQLRARGNRNADGSELAAEEIVAGTFRNVAGLITAIDATAQTITVNDLATKKPAVVEIGSDAQLHKLPEMVATALAMRLRMTRGETAGAAEGGRPQGLRPTEGPRPQQGGASTFAGRSRNGAAPDMHQMLSRMPAVTLADLKKGDAVMIVTTQPSAAAAALTAVTLLTGVEPILTASPEAGMLLSPWSIGGGAGEGGAPPQ